MSMHSKNWAGYPTFTHTRPSNNETATLYRPVESNLQSTT
jgi:hypothetical protein